MRLTVVRNPGLAPVQETRTYVQGCLAFFGLADEEQALGVTRREIPAPQMFSG